MAELISVSYEFIKVKELHSLIHSCIGDVVFDRKILPKLQ
jgi:hypothetical protein